MATIVVFPEFINSMRHILQNKSDDKFEIYGLIQDDYVFQLRDLKLNKEYYNKSWKFIGTLESKNKSQGLVKIFKDIQFVLDIEEIINNRRLSKNFDFKDSQNNNKSENLDIFLVDLSRLFLRIDAKDVPLAVLNQKKVGIIGLGSGGALIAQYLSKAGVRDFVFIDKDIFQEHNIIRHICSLKDVGRYKTYAIRDFLLERIPDLRITTVEDYFNTDTKETEEKFWQILSDRDLLISTTGDHSINYKINRFAYTYGLNTVYAGTTDKIGSGLMIRVEPSNGDVCYNCIYGKEKIIPTTTADEVSVTYDRKLEDIFSQPGLGIDIDNVTIFVVRFIMYTLLRRIENTLYPFPYNVYIWYNKDIEQPIHIDGLELYYVPSLIRIKDCGICSIEKKLGES